MAVLTLAVSPMRMGLVKGACGRTCRFPTTNSIPEEDGEAESMSLPQGTPFISIQNPSQKTHRIAAQADL
jgi:hypothetical protein